MKNQTILFILFLIAVYSTSLISCTKKRTYETNEENSIEYLEMPEDLYNFVTTEAIINDSIKGRFILDTGHGGNSIILDSTIFYNNVDTSQMKLDGIIFKRNLRYTHYSGNATITIGNNQFQVSRIEVVDMKRAWAEKGYEVAGLIGEDAFLNKITIIDFDENKIAFVDSLEIDASYTAIPMVGPRKGNYINQKFIEIGGLTNKEGEPKEGYFLFDTGHFITGLQLKRSYAEDMPQEKAQLKDKDIMWRLDSLSLGDITLHNVPLRRTIDGVSDRYEKLQGGDGLLGMALIKRFNVILDYKNDILYLKPNKYFPEKNKKVHAQ